MQIENRPVASAPDPGTDDKLEVPARTQVDKAAIEQAIRAQEAQWTAELKARDIDALISHGGPDGTSNAVNPGAETASFEEQRKFWENLFKDPNFDYPFVTHYFGIADSGELAYCRGDYEMWGTDPETQQAAVLSRGTYINVWRQDAAGNWKTIEDLVVPVNNGSTTTTQ